MLKRVGRIGLFLVLLFAGCEAERDNPRDPRSPYHYGGIIVGWVTTNRDEPIEGVKVSAEPDNKYVFTDVEGYYVIPDIFEDTALVFAFKDGYASESVWVEINHGWEDTARFFLDALPQFIRCKVYTVHDGDDCWMEIAAEVFDSDKEGGRSDIDSVLFWVAGIGDTFFVPYPDSLYHKELYASDFNLQSLESLIGRNSYFIAWDSPGKFSVSEPRCAERIINVVPELISPVNFNPVGPNPDLVWKSINLPYPYTYTVELLRTSGGIFWNTEGISEIDTVFTVPDPPFGPALESGQQYKWQVWVVDEYGNRSSSLEKGFTVE